MAASSTAARHSGATGVPSGDRAVHPTRRRPGSRPTSAANGAGGAGSATGSPGAGPASASSSAAASRTERVTARLATAPCHPSPVSGPSGTRPRDGLRPNRPQKLAGIRIEPPPSLASAAGTTRAATAAAAPPDEPPGVRLGAHGLRAGA